VSSFLYEYASLSSLAKRVILRHFLKTHQINLTSTTLTRRVGGRRLDGLLIQSPHTPVTGCTTTLSSDDCVRGLMLTDSSHPFVAWITISVAGLGTVVVFVRTTEAPVRESGAFKDRFPVTTQLARAVLRAVISAMLFDQ